MGLVSVCFANICFHKIFVFVCNFKTQKGDMFSLFTIISLKRYICSLIDSTELLKLSQEWTKTCFICFFWGLLDLFLMQICDKLSIMKTLTSHHLLLWSLCYSSLLFQTKPIASTCYLCRLPQYWCCYGYPLWFSRTKHKEGSITFYIGG